MPVLNVGTTENLVFIVLKCRISCLMMMMTSAQSEMTLERKTRSSWLWGKRKGNSETWPGPTQRTPGMKPGILTALSDMSSDLLQGLSCHPTVHGTLWIGRAATVSCVQPGTPHLHATGMAVSLQPALLPTLSILFFETWCYYRLPDSKATNGLIMSSPA